MNINSISRFHTTAKNGRIQLLLIMCLPPSSMLRIQNGAGIFENEEGEWVSVPEIVSATLRMYDKITDLYQYT